MLGKNRVLNTSCVDFSIQATLFDFLATFDSLTSAN